jgi:hypothetical protein
LDPHPAWTLSIEPMILIAVSTSTIVKVAAPPVFLDTDLG